MTSTIENLLRQRAEELRAYLDGPISGEHLRVLCDFPRGCCKVGSIFFLKWIGDRDGIRSGFGVANAARGPEDSQQTHAWVEVEGYVVDITADQFSDFAQAVFVGRASDWHGAWTGAMRYPHSEFTSIERTHLLEYKLLSRHLGGGLKNRRPENDL